MICVHMYLCTSTNARILTEEALIYGCMVTFSVLYILLYSPHTIRKINLRKERECLLLVISQFCSVDSANCKNVLFSASNERNWDFVIFHIMKIELL